MWIDTHNAFLEYTELLKSLTELEYLRMQAPIKSNWNQKVSIPPSVHVYN